MSVEEIDLDKIFKGKYRPQCHHCHERFKTMRILIPHVQAHRPLQAKHGFSYKLKGMSQTIYI